jgi:hypothetical protein
MAKKNMGKVRDLIKAAPDNAVISNGIRTYTKEQALKLLDKDDILDRDVHLVKDGVIYIQILPGGFITRPMTVMAVKIEKPNQKGYNVDRKDYPDPEGHDDQV